MECFLSIVKEISFPHASTVENVIIFLLSNANFSQHIFDTHKGNEQR